MWRCRVDLPIPRSAQHSQLPAATMTSLSRMRRRLRPTGSCSGHRCVRSSCPPTSSELPVRSRQLISSAGLTRSISPVRLHSARQISPSRCGTNAFTPEPLRSASLSHQPPSRDIPILELSDTESSAHTHRGKRAVRELFRSVITERLPSDSEDDPVTKPVCEPRLVQRCPDGSPWTMLPRGSSPRSPNSATAPSWSRTERSCRHGSPGSSLISTQLASGRTSRCPTRGSSTSAPDRLIGSPSTTVSNQTELHAGRARRTPVSDSDGRSRRRAEHRR